MENIDIRDYLRPLIKWWWLVIIAVLIASISSAMYTLQLPATYRARTTFMVGTAIQDPNPNSGAVYLTQTLAETYADIARRQTIYQATAESLGLPWLPEYSVWVVPNSSVVEIQVDAEDPALAQAVANELVVQLIRQSPAGQEKQERQAFIGQRLTKLEQDITATEKEITSKREELSLEISASKIAATQKDINALETKLTSLQTLYASMLTNTQQGAVNKINILEEATLPNQPLGSGLKTNVLLAAMLGFVLASAGAYILEYLDDSIKSRNDVKRHLGSPTLGQIPLISNEEWSGEEKLVMLGGAQSPSIEAFRILRTNLQFTSIDKPLKSMLITSPMPGDGKSLTASNLAASLAGIGKKVVLVDADLHKPKQHRLFKLVNNIGVTTALLGEKWDFDTLLRHTSISGLRILTSGPLPPNPAELLGSQRMRQMLTELEKIADIVIIDSPPANIVSDTTILSTVCDGTLLVLRAKTTRRDIAKRALNALKQVQANVIGIVLNGVSSKAVGYGYNYGYSYNYSYGHNAARSKKNPRRKSRLKIWRKAGQQRKSNGLPAQHVLNNRPKQANQNGYGYAKPYPQMSKKRL